ncbi:MAG: CRP/FNR family cyclic AMP-dependent transcriptional regulator [Limisphaerales bacterium]|jgi:CRP-like cAMP-binding protein
MHSLNEKNLRLSEDIELNKLTDGIRLLKQCRTGEFLALNGSEFGIVNLFDGTAAVKEIFYTVLTEGERPKIKEFYDLVFEAYEKGFLYEGDEEPVSPKRQGYDWYVYSTPLAAMSFPLVVITAGVSAVSIANMALIPSIGGWFLMFVFVSCCLSLGSFMAGAALRAFDRRIYNPHVRMDLGIPFFAIDPRDAFMGGRSCEAVVALNTIAAPFLFSLMGWSLDSVPLFLSGWVTALILSAPFGGSPAHHLLHAMFRKAHVVPRNADKFLQNKVISQIFNWKETLAEEKYFVVYSTYAILWLGGVFNFASRLLKQQASELLTDPGALMMVFVLAIVVASPIVYVCWMACKNLWRMLAPSLAPVESRVSAGARESWKPDNKALVDFLESTLLFNELPKEELSAVADAMRFIPVKAGKPIIRERDQGDLFFMIYKGEVEVLKDDEAGDPVSVAKLSAGDVFGEIALLQKVPRTSSVSSLTKCDLLALNKADFENLLVDTLGAKKIQQLVQVCAFLRRNPLFSGWPSRALIKIANEFTVEDCAVGHEVIEEGHHNEFFYLIYEGEFEVSKGGKEVARLGPGEFCGEISLLRGVPANARVAASQPTRCLRLDKDGFLELVSQDFVMALGLDREADRRQEAKRGRAK